MRMWPLGILLCTASITALAEGEPLKLPTREMSFKTRDGREFEKAIIIRVVGPRVEVARHGSLEMLHVTDLPPELQKQFPSALAAATAPKIGEIISFETLQQRQFKDVWLRRIEPHGITVETAEGLVRVDYTSLPEDLRARFNYDPKQASRFAAQLSAAEQARAARAAAEKQAATAAALAAAQQQQQQSAPQTAPAGGLGEQGARSLGTPQLGGSGTTR